jgi:hypothetical protein
MKDRALTTAAPSPDPAAANNLFTFLSQRLTASFTNLNCPQRPPMRIGRGPNGVAVQAVPADPGTSATPTPSLLPQTPLPTRTRRF